MVHLVYLTLLLIYDTSFKLELAIVLDKFFISYIVELGAKVNVIYGFIYLVNGFILETFDFIFKISFNSCNIVL